MLAKDREFFTALFEGKPPLTDANLQSWIEVISSRCFKRPFTHQAKVNRRLKTTGGRYHLTNHHIDINPLVYEKYGWSELVDVILHELCHYHLHLTGCGYQHRDADFKQLLQAVGGSRYVKPLAEHNYRYQYQCQTCHQIYQRQKRLDTNRYRCHCRGQLHLIEQNKENLREK
ncbi:SprT family protein [Vagococcus zengguangii]|uniref:SprT family protein n=1 Tax=Vagococcus zengguangii TaxID=2571750 RepID=A0A4D7CWV2_9ENTE|nr:SprT family protein [Vagococcus zengguangii]QCI86821.1 SprT family protein [Vagococcus zengguangii]TLG80427.1 SprT family protein [Vagococcus zengguangii]